MFRKFIFVKVAFSALFGLFLLSNVTYAREEGVNFIENKGQWGHGIQYEASIPGGAFFLTKQGLVYNFVNVKDFDAFSENLDKGIQPKPNGIHFHAYKVNFVGVNQPELITKEGMEKRDHYNNYFINNDPSKWEGRVGLFGKVKLGDVYNGIDLYVYSNNAVKDAQLIYDFVVGSGANPGQIKLSFDGVSPQLGKDGSLIIQTSVNKVVEQAPYCYQEINGEQVVVPSKYVLKNGVVSFAFPKGYNNAYPLTIDPNLIFATFSSATGTNAFYAHSTTYDDQGDTYASGLSTGVGWPTTTGAYQTTYPGNWCTCINKYSTNGTALLFSTYFGASGGYVEPNTMRVDGEGNLVVGGATSAYNLPVTTGAYQTTMGGGDDIYISKFSSDGATLLASTFVGGSADEASQIGDDYQYTSLGGSDNPRNPVEVAFDNKNNVWVTSNTRSSNFPVTSNAQQSTLSGGTDAVVFELDSSLTTLDYSTYLGGSGWDGGMAIEFDPDSNIVVAGMTNSSNFPTTSGVLHASSLGGDDGFVTRINPVSGSIINSTYLGTSGTDDAERINFDCSGNVYIAGRDLSGNYPVSSGAWSNPGGYLYVQKLSPDLSTSINSTTVGSSVSSAIVASAFMVDQCGDIVIGTVTSASPQYGLELTPDAIQTGAAPFYLAIIDSHFDQLDYGSYFGTSPDHFHPAVSRLDKGGAFYQSVCTTSSSWPAQPSNVVGYVKGNGYTNDVATFKFNFDVVSLSLKEQTGHGGNENIPHCVRGCKSAFFDIFRKHADTVNLTVHYQLSGSATRGVDYADPGAGDSVVIPAGDTMARVEIKPLLVPNMPTGMKDVTLSVFSPCGCDGSNNSVIQVGTIQILDSLYVKIPTPPDTTCAHTEVTITGQIDTTLNFAWEPQALIPDPRPLGLTIHPSPITPATFLLTVTQPGAPATCPPHTVGYHVTVEQYPKVTMVSQDTTVCINPGDSIPLTNYVEPEGVNYNYQWTPATFLRDNNTLVNEFSAPVGTYNYALTVTSPLAHCIGTNNMTIHVVPPFKFTSVTPVDTLINYGDTVRLDAEGAAVSWVWLPVDYLNDPNLQSPTSKPLKTIQYKVIGLDQYGCRDTGEVNIQVKYVPNFFIPSAFSPNGDGVNDVFRIQNLQFAKVLTFQIYNRLGQMVFSTKNNINGWDGTFNGKPAPADTYFYLIKIVLPDGQHQTFKGDVTLIR